MVKSRNAIIILGLVGAFILGTLTANPVVDAVGGWKEAFDILQDQINDLGFTTQTCPDSPNSFVIGINSDGTIVCSGKLDLVVPISGQTTGMGDKVSILLGDGTGSFPTRTDFPLDTDAVGIAIGDFG